MKKLLFLVLGIVILAQGCQNKSELTDADKEAIVQAVKQASNEYWAIWSSTYNTDTYGKLKKYSDLNTDQLWQTDPVAFVIDTTITYKQSEGLSLLESTIASRISSPTNIKESFYSVLSNEKILEVLKGDLTIIMKDSTVIGPLAFVMSQIWTNIDGEWKIQFFHNAL